MHFIKHSLVLAMLAILTGCGGGSASQAPAAGGSPSTPEDTVQVSSVTPLTATVGVLSTFKLTGQKLSSLDLTLPNCQDIRGKLVSATEVTFTCTPQAEGTNTLTVTTTEGTRLFTSELTFQTAVPTKDILISNVSVPPNVVTGELATFTITGQNLTSTLQINLNQCINPTQTSVTATQIVFTCLPQVAGAQTFSISSAGKLLNSRLINVQIPPPALTGSWQQTAAAGCTGTIDGEAIVGVRSRKPLFTFVGDVKTQVRLLGNEGISYTTANCSEVDPVPTTPPRTVFALTTGIATPAAVYGNIAAVQKADNTFYYPVTTNYSNNSTATPPATAIVFKNADTFCLFDGIVNAANISQYIQNVDLTRLGCFARSSRAPFSRVAPSTLLTTYQYQLPQRQDNETLLSMLQRLNQRGATGYALLSAAKTLGTDRVGGSGAVYDLLTQIEVFSDYSFEYLTRDEPAQDANFEINRLTQLNELGAQGRLFLGRQSLNALSTPKTLYAKGSPSSGSLKTFNYQLRSDSDLTTSKLIGILDAYGAQGCRFVDTRLQATPANTHATVCVNSSAHNGQFAYRAVPYPTSTRADALKELLDDQKNSGFYPIRVMNVGAGAAPYLLFEYDSSTAVDIQAMQYKLYAQALPSTAPELADLMNDQGKLGWTLWSPINTVNGAPLATIFASIPFPHLLDGEPVSLDPR